MSYVSLLRNIPEFLSQPAGIAAIASVGIHGAIAFIMPLMPVESKPKQASSPKTVGLVELNAAEQNRLPQTGIPLVALQPESLQPQLSQPNFASQVTPTLPPPLPTPSSTQLILPPLPKSPGTFSISSVPRGQSLRIIPKKDLQIIPALHPRRKSFPLEERVRLGESKPLASSSVPYNVPSVQPGKISEDLLDTPPATSDTTSNYSTAEGITTPQSTEQVSEASKVIENGQLVAPVAPPQVEDNSIATAGQNQPQQSMPKMPEPLSATEVALRKTTAFSEQWATLKLRYPNIEPKQKVFATINVPAEQEGTVEGGLVVDPEGKVESINYLEDSVSWDTRSAVNKHFRDYLPNNPPQANGKYKFYPFSLSLRSNSSNPETAPELSPFSPKNQTQVSSDAQRILIQRLTSPQVNPQSSKPQGNLSVQPLRSPEVNPKPFKKPQGNLSVQPLRSPEVNPKPFKKPQGNLSVQPLRLPFVNPQLPKEQLRNLEQQLPVTVPQVNQQQNPPRQVIVKLPVTVPQANQQQSPPRQMIVKLPASTPQANQQQTSQQQVSSNQASPSLDPSQKLLRQLREHREKRQSSHQEQ